MQHSLWCQSWAGEGEMYFFPCCVPSRQFFSQGYKTKQNKTSESYSLHGSNNCILGANSGFRNEGIKFAEIWILINLTDMKNADPEKLVQFCLQLLKYSKIQTPNSHSVLLKLFLFVYQKKKKKNVPWLSKPDVQVNISQDSLKLGLKIQ